MSYDVLILVFLILVFCFFSMMLVVNVMFTLFNSARPEGMKEIKPIFPRKTTPKKTRAQAEAERKYEIIMENLEAYDGTEIGQKEVK